MSQFEYVSVLVSIVLALGLSEVIICWVRLVQHRTAVRFSLLHGFWSLFVLALMIQYWWGLWQFRDHAEWSLTALAILIANVIALVFAILMLLPGRVIPAGLDLKEWYYANSKPFFLLSCVALTLLTLAQTHILGESLFDTESIIRQAGAAGCLVLAFARNPRLHNAFPVVALLLFSYFLARGQAI